MIDRVLARQQRDVLGRHGQVLAGTEIGAGNGQLLNQKYDDF
ncbi:hypothetical protein ACQR5V_07085 [Xanthomonas oryzae pv. oryzicola]|nr:hypothetical protein [Xanthomonas oryzae]